MATAIEFSESGESYTFLKQTDGLSRNATGVLLRNLRFADCSPRRSGSPVEIEESEVTIEDCHFEGNRANRGGAVSLLKGSLLTLRD